MIKEKTFYASCEYAFSKINVCGIRDGFPLKVKRKLKSLTFFLCYQKGHLMNLVNI